MAERREFEGKDERDALRAAAAALGIPEARLSFGKLDSSRRGLFGFGKRVRIWAEPTAEGSVASPQTALEESFSNAEGSAENVAWVEATLRQIVELMSFDLRVAAKAEVGGVRAELTGPDHARLVQAEGELLDALQYLLNRIMKIRRPGTGRVRLECDGFRQERDQDLIELARETARQVALTGKARWLPAMNPYERRLVHLTVEEVSGVSTSSSGDGFLKRIRVTPAKAPGQA